MKHSITLETDDGRTRAVCVCGRWRSKPSSRSAAVTAGRRHSKDSGNGCGKKKYGSYDEAQLIIVDAKIARSLYGDTGRAEQRSYYCSTCEAWHTTSRGEL